MRAGWWLRSLMGLFVALSLARCGRGDASAVSESKTSPATTQAAPDAPAVHEVFVQLLGSLDNIKGHAWTRGRDPIHNRDDVPLGITSIMDPHLMTVRLPSGRLIQAP